RATDQASNQNQQRQADVMMAYRVGELFDRIWRIRVHLSISGFPLAARGGDQRGRILELGHQTVDRRLAHLASSATSACGKMVRISKMEIIGRKRMNRNSKLRNSPNVPRYVIQSHRVG